MLFLLLFSLFFLYSVDLCTSQTLERFDSFNKVVHISEVVKGWDLDHEVSGVCERFVEAGVDFRVFGGCEVDLVS